MIPETRHPYFITKIDLEEYILTTQRIAVLITCHNRKDKTIACLQSLSKQTLDSNILLDIYVVDDGSTDGTESSIQSMFPDVILLRGDGNLFWAGGTRLAFNIAKEKDYDFYLWLNDDVLLYKHTIGGLISSHKTLARDNETPAIVVGSTIDEDNGELTYGGVVRSNPKWRPLQFQQVKPSSKLQECETMNGNCVLIPRDVANKVGNLDSRFSHGIADYHYGLRARSLGCSIWISPEYSGTCARNLADGTWQDTSLSVRDRWRLLLDIKHLPLKEWRILAKEHAGFFWIIYWLSPYLRFLLSSVLGKRTVSQEP